MKSRRKENLMAEDSESHDIKVSNCIAKFSDPDLHSKPSLAQCEDFDGSISSCSCASLSPLSINSPIMEASKRKKKSGLEARNPAKNMPKTISTPTKKAKRKLMEKHKNEDHDDDGCRPSICIVEDTATQMNSIEHTGKQISGEGASICTTLSTISSKSIKTNSSVNGKKRFHNRISANSVASPAVSSISYTATSVSTRSSVRSSNTRKSSRTKKSNASRYYGTQNEFKRAMKASLETHEQELSKRRLIHDVLIKPLTRNDRIASNRYFSFNEFKRLWTYCEKILGVTTEEIENGSMVRAANHSNITCASKSVVSDNTSTTKKIHTYSSNQAKAQYGRILFPAMKKIIEITNLTYKDIFIDIGHGIGNATLQCAFTTGCEARGVEIVPERCRIAEEFRSILFESVDMMAKEKSAMCPKVGKVDLHEGCLTDPKNRKFIIDANVVLVNNAHDIFGTRSSDIIDGTPTLDTHVGSLFASMSPGSRMVTLHPILCLGRSVTEENEIRRKRGLEESIDASFFLYEKQTLEKVAVTWSYEDVYIHIYTRIPQSHPDGVSVFLCANKKCTWKSPTVAVGENGLLQDVCIYCDTKRVVRTRK